jgi:hypothetical protein
MDTEAMLDLLEPCLKTILTYYKDNIVLKSEVSKESAEQCDAWKAETPE